MTIMSYGTQISTMHYVEPESVHEMDKENDEIQNGNLDNLGFKLMYNEWMQKILLSDGVDENDNPEW